ncbi:uncharacterized protein LOC110760775 [Prunus avium]|uniref:Uncharacterized protein LOC110760775 n=1 Tax=Prunus avium TaxID=42229 RepID=A0A6P5SRK3_PRUAV|nr:uncharacterized protein LOC110760775 [Prunus avium]
MASLSSHSHFTSDWNLKSPVRQSWKILDKKKRTNEFSICLYSLILRLLVLDFCFLWKIEFLHQNTLTSFQIMETENLTKHAGQQSLSQEFLQDLATSFRVDIKEFRECRCAELEGVLFSNNNNEDR